ncbi:sensor histidine kinase [Actinocorallia libanotica]|uniref:histidine kinase n=1 Tax=Actinocorallia libanotica TaxID=46162 RepID=A0ABN1RPV1_9ACTN
MTIRTRLTATFTALFLLAGMVLLGVTYLLVSAKVPTGAQIFKKEILGPDGAGGFSPESVPRTDVVRIKAAQEDVLGSILTQGAIGLVVVGAVAAALGWLIAGRLLQPLQRMTETARRIADAPAAGRGLHERIGLPGPRDEVKELADTFDLMLARLDASFDGQRRFIADASHELRTPLTLNRALLEVALRRADAPPEVRQLGETLLEINDRHERLVEGLLMLARSDAEMADRAYLDLADLAEHVAKELDHEGVEVVAELLEAPMMGDATLIERLVRNLLENAVRHNVPEGGWVRIGTAAGPDGAAVLTIANSGPPISPYEIPALFTPFHRGNRSRLHSPGAGLGLPIVRSIATAHSAVLRTDAPPSGGLTHTLTFPPVPEELRTPGEEDGVLVQAGVPTR